MNKSIFSIIVVLAVGFTASAQQNTVSAGGDFSGAGGSVSFTVGQVAYTTVMNANGSVAQGVQQAFGGCAETTSSFTIVACNSYTVPSGDETYTVSGLYNDTIDNVYGCDSVMTIQVYVNEAPTITHFTSREHDQWRVNWTWTLPDTPNDTNFRIRYWEQGSPLVFADKSQFPISYQKKVSGLDANTWYDVKVGFACLDGSFIWGGTESVKTKIIACATPTNLSQSLPASLNQATVLWDNQGATEYKVRYRLASTSIWNYSTVSSSTRTLGGLNEFSNYEYQVKALCTLGLWSSYSSIGTFSTIPVVDDESFGRLAADAFEQFSFYPNPNKGTMALNVPVEGAPY
ncbi:MAG: hypothetical protein ACI9FU_000346, partial [Granulosicoccus sp.]